MRTEKCARRQTGNAKDTDGAGDRQMVLESDR